LNKSESKYFNTAVKMDEAFLEILQKKDFSFITVKEICEKAGVNRSTFYLHYETLADLLRESAEYLNEHFLAHFAHSPENFISKIKDCPLGELYLVMPDYLIPYLEYVKEYRRIFLTAMDNAAVLQLENSYSAMFSHIFNPILDRFDVPENERVYIVSFYIQGLMSIVLQWLRSGCAESVGAICAVMCKCVPFPQ